MARPNHGLLKMFVQHLSEQHRMRDEDIAEETGLALATVQSFVGEKTVRGKRPMMDVAARRAEAQARQDEIDARTPAPREYVHDGADVPVGPPAE